MVTKVAEPLLSLYTAGDILHNSLQPALLRVCPGGVEHPDFGAVLSPKMSLKVADFTVLVQQAQHFLALLRST